MKSVVRPRALFGALGISLVLVLWLSLALGPVSLPLGDTLRAALRLAGLPLDGTGLAQAEMILGQIRLPRTLLGLAVGAVLALSGVAMQGLFRNPLADPGLVGVSSGAALGAALAIVFGASLGGLPAFLAPYLLSLCAFGGGLGGDLAGLSTWPPRWPDQRGHHVAGRDRLDRAVRRGDRTVYLSRR